MLKFRKVLKWLIILTIIIKATTVGLIFVYPLSGYARTAEISSEGLVALTDSYRAQLGLIVLAKNNQLMAAAHQKALDMLAGGYFSHTSPLGRHFSDWMKVAGYDYFYAGENLAIDFTNNQEIFTAWINSPKHKENIINPVYQEIGLAVVKGRYNGHESTVVVQLFGSRPNLVMPVAGTTPSQKSAKTSFFGQPPSLSNLEKISLFSNFLFFLLLALLLITYQPRKISQIKIAKPKTIRYQAKTASE